MNKIKICHLYPDTLNLYGDRGNILCMQKRLEWRGIEAEIYEVPVGDTFSPDDYDIYFIGGGQDFEQSIMLEDLKKVKGDAIKKAIEDEKVFLTICGGYQLLGQYYKTPNGEQLDCLGALNLYTIGTKNRMIGDFMFKLNDADGGQNIIGFENHSGKTYLGDGVKSLGTIISGSGNNGEDGSEGARYKNVFATYSHGPLLPKNPKLCDHILKIALSAKHPEFDLEPLDDTFEDNAFAFMENRLK